TAKREKFEGVEKRAVLGLFSHRMRKRGLVLSTPQRRRWLCGTEADPTGDSSCGVFQCGKDDLDLPADFPVDRKGVAGGDPEAPCQGIGFGPPEEGYVAP